jgi:DNA polymerase-3 subunit gamma/tau
LLAALRAQNGSAVLEIADNMATRSVAFDSALQELATLLHRITLAQTVPQAIADDEPERARLLELAHAFAPEEVQLYYQIAIHGRDEIDLAPDEYAGFTMTLLRMLAFVPGKGVAQVGTAPAPVPVRAMPQTTSVAPVAATPPAAASSTSVAAAPVSSVADAASQPDWGVLLTQLNVQGMAQQLAKHCVLQSFSDGQITLCLAQEQKHLQTNKMATDKLQAALGEYFAQPVKLNIVLGKAEVATPAAMEQQGKELKQQQAVDVIAHDAFVREAQAELGASLITESIKPV